MNALVDQRTTDSRSKPLLQLLAVTFLAALSSCNESTDLSASKGTASSNIIVPSALNSLNSKDQNTAHLSSAPVSSLIGGLAKRLNTKPNDPNGWVLLARSYYFVGDTENAKKAETQARRYGYAGNIETAETSRAPNADLPTNHPPITQRKLLPKSLDNSNAVMNSLQEIIENGK